MDSDNDKRSSVNRRDFVKIAGGGGLAVTAGLGGCASAIGGSGGAASSLTVSSFGGAFKEILDEHLFGPFEEESGITMNSQAQGGPRKSSRGSAARSRAATRRSTCSS